jgi:alkylhydroperoxidase family enzyme
MPIVSPLPANHDEEVRELSRFFDETLGFTPNSVLTMQRRPEIARAFIQLNKAVMANHGRVTAEQKRLIGYLTSEVAGCRYCQAHTILAAQRYGGTNERLAAIWNFRMRCRPKSRKRCAVTGTMGRSSRFSASSRCSGI